jgi:peptidyl-prolyl cis-trans isomerase B (cyclophilin B)
MPRVKMITNHGPIVLELNPEKAPKTVANFLEYVNSGFYTGTLFHRVISNFVIQGGGLESNMQPKTTKPPIENEADNGLANDLGSIAMARTNDPHSASSQFFINVGNNTFLNHTRKDTQGWGYCVFGRVVEGMDVVESIKQVPTGTRFGYQDVPKEDVIIESVEVLDN